MTKRDAVDTNGNKKYTHHFDEDRNRKDRRAVKDDKLYSKTCTNVFFVGKKRQTALFLQII